jgi:Mg-chelatase subunit ChlD
VEVVNLTSKAVVQGSLSSVAQQSGQSLAESFLSADVIVLVDVSGSMNQRDSRGGRSRYEVACDELAKLQKSNPGKLAVVAFSSSTEFCPSGVPAFLSGSTDLAGALQFVSVADGTLRFIVISDGQPDDEAEALRVARTFISSIDVVYVGPETDLSGAQFLQKLAKAASGRYTVASRAQELASTIETLMLKAG